MELASWRPATRNEALFFNVSPDVESGPIAYQDTCREGIRACRAKRCEANTHGRAGWVRAQLEQDRMTPNPHGGLTWRNQAAAQKDLRGFSQGTAPLLQAKRANAVLRGAEAYGLGVPSAMRFA